MIISSGGNSESQATTLVIRAMALGQIKLNDWWRVVRREFVAGILLGLLLGVIGFLRIVIWQIGYQMASGQQVYDDHYILSAVPTLASLAGGVNWGSAVRARCA